MLTTTVERLEGIAVKLTVTVSADEVDEAIDKAYKDAAKKVRIPGFRPGKAPRQMIDSMVGREYVLTDATENVVNDSYSRALDIENLRPVESPEIKELDTVEPGAEFTYWAEIDVRPELALSSHDDFAITLPATEATDEEIDVQVEAARERFASLEPVEGRPVASDDFVLISFVGTVDGEPYEGNEVDKYLYELGRGLMPQEFDESILGLEAGDRTHVEFPIPDTTSNPDFAGKTAAFDITVHEIKAKKLPDLDDEFAANVGGFDSFSEMRKDLGLRITKQKEVSIAQMKERRAREAVAERLEGDVPEAMVVQRQSSMMRDFMTMLESRDLMITDYLAQAGIDMDTLESDLKEQATQSVREDLALEALFRALELEITDEDLAGEFEEIAQATESTVEKARERWEELGLMAVLREQIMHRKSVLWLLDNMSVGEEPAEAPEKSDEE